MDFIVFAHGVDLYSCKFANTISTVCMNNDDTINEFAGENYSCDYAYNHKHKIIIKQHATSTCPNRILGTLTCLFIIVTSPLYKYNIIHYAHLYWNKSMCACWHERPFTRISSSRCTCLCGGLNWCFCCCYWRFIFGFSAQTHGTLQPYDTYNRSIN